MKKLETFLNSLKKKELYYLYASILIVVFIIYYMFIYPDLIKKESKLEKSIKKNRQELYKVAGEIRSLKKDKKSYKPLKIKLAQLQDDYQYIKYSSGMLDLVHLNSEKIFYFVKNILEMSKNLNIKLSLEFDWKYPIPKPFSKGVLLTISGSSSYSKIINLVNYIESQNVLSKFNELEITLSTDGLEKASKTDMIGNLVKALIIGKDLYITSASVNMQNYSKKNILVLKKVAKNNNLNISISQYSNYGVVKINGYYKNIKKYFEFLSKFNKRYNSNINFYGQTAELKHIAKDIFKKQNFVMKLLIVGVE